jgi:hypothetical protein
VGVDVAAGLLDRLQVEPHPDQAAVGDAEEPPPPSPRSPPRPACRSRPSTRAFGGKPGLVRAIYDRGLAGREPVPAYQRADELRERETDPRAIMRNWGTIASEVSSSR